TPSPLKSLVGIRRNSSSLINHGARRRPVVGRQGGHLPTRHNHFACMRLHLSQSGDCVTTRSRTLTSRYYLFARSVTTPRMCVLSCNRIPRGFSRVGRPLGNRGSARLAEWGHRRLTPTTVVGPDGSQSDRPGFLRAIRHLPDRISISLF